MGFGWLSPVMQSTAVYLRYAAFLMPFMHNYTSIAWIIHDECICIFFQSVAVTRTAITKWISYI